MTDEAAQKHGHTVLRLPVAHCELNPIELAWASVKGYVAKHNQEFSLREVKRLTPEGFAHTTVDMWRGFCRHVVDVENRYIEKDGICEDTVEEMRIEIGDEDESDDDDDDYDDVDDLLDDSDRQLIDRVLEQTSTSTSTQTADVCTNVRRDLTERLQDYEPHFLESVLPLP